MNGSATLRSLPVAFAAARGRGGLHCEAAPLLKQ